MKYQTIILESKRVFYKSGMHYYLLSHHFILIPLTYTFLFLIIFCTGNWCQGLTHARHLFHEAKFVHFLSFFKCPHDLPKLPRLSPNLRSYFSLFNGWYCHWDGRYVPASISIKEFSVLMFVSMQYYSGDNKQNLFHSAN